MSWRGVVQSVLNAPLRSRETAHFFASRGPGKRGPERFQSESGDVRL
ncbi:MAG: hypothetical protein QOF73_2544 [Thermomicrobiales bacterium]|nr:hypothetical protein [Thermomicrobiales bacterium]